ncbi:hypothetical protein SAY87_028340 [Trapa incisa]|uniref:Uncharacterized protein n=1 Tax=Trapa incisa TaxID=236973 RepID=A0AAN7KUI6_9MYRT|nr:hypothetical protein SAY87_028340 [Trapa incisa]
MDEKINVWVLDFLLRQPSVADSVLKHALSTLSLPPDSSIPLHLKKSILLRTVKSDLSLDSITESLLDHLEALESIDDALGDPVSSSMKDAYRSVALECTLGVEGRADYAAAVQRIWRGRIQGMDSKSQLITPELLSWNVRLEEAMSDEVERKNLMGIDCKADALRSLHAYLDEAYVKFGPSFIEMAALAQGKNDVALPKSTAEPDADAIAANRKNERLKTVVPSKIQQVQWHRRRGGGIKITCGGELGRETSHSRYDILPTPLVDKVQDALRSSASELQATVQDPLPEAIQVADSLVTDGAEATQKNPEPLPPEAGEEARAPHLSGTNAAPANSHQNVLPRRSLMERHSSAQALQWDDSPGGTSDQKDRPKLDSPKRRAISPLRPAEAPKVSKRRRNRPWSLQEEDILRDGVKRFGLGQWKHIRKCYIDIFEDRTEVDLKDKWRNMMR